VGRPSLRHASSEAKKALARPGRNASVAGNLQVKEVRVGEGARVQRFVVCHNPEEAERDQRVRANLVAYLETQIAGSDDWTKSRRDELAGRLRTTPARGAWYADMATDGSALTMWPSQTRPNSTASCYCAPPTTPSPLPTS